MARVAVITDSSACLPAALAERPEVRVLPIAIHLASEDLLDDMPSAAQRVYEALERGEEVKSTPPSPLDYLTAVEEAEADAVVVVTPAREFTVMHRNASIAADLSDRHVVVIDSRTAAVGQGLIVRAGADAAETASLDTVLTAVETAAEKVQLVATLESLDFIKRSGRLPPPAFELAQHLGIRPLFRLRDGRVERIGISRSEETSLRRLRKECAQGGKSPNAVWVFHARRERLAEKLAASLGGADELTEFSPSMGIHTGPGVFGLAWLRQEAGS